MQHKIGTVFSCVDEIEGGEDDAFVRLSTASHADQFVPDRFGVARGGILQDVGDEVHSALIEGRMVRNRLKGVPKRFGRVSRRRLAVRSNLVVGLRVDGHG